MKSPKEVPLHVEPVEEFYHVADPYLAAVLVTLGFPLRRVDYERRVDYKQGDDWIFAFPWSEDIVHVPDNYWTNELLVNPRAFVMSLNEIQREMDNAARECNEPIVLHDEADQPAKCRSEPLHKSAQDNELLLPPGDIRETPEGEATVNSDVAPLRAVYKMLYHTLPWPKPIPRPGEVEFRWNHRWYATDGRCSRQEQIIEVSDVYQDPRLRKKLEYLIAHEAAHFIWHGHSKPYKDFLRGVGIPAEYISSIHSSSEVYRAVKTERRPPRYRYRCPTCGIVIPFYRRMVASCSLCAPDAYSPQFRLELYDPSINPIKQSFPR
ncbi:MAG: hypothetical protein Q8R30_04765 [bacterium]|nr:hypothetical protein [bacterium]